jgi:hypothetical protein
MGSELVCSNCERGQNACQYCYDLARLDWETICDCGLYDFGAHLLDCAKREGYRWVVASDYASAGERL